MTKSKCKKIKDIDYTTKIVITKLQVGKNEFEEHQKRLRVIFKNATEDEIQKRLNDIVVRENIFSEIMNIIVPCFEFEIDQDELNKNIQQFSIYFKEQPKDFVEKFSANVIKKSLIFEYLANQWEIKTSDIEVNRSLEGYYKASNQSIREYYNDKEKFENIRKVMTDEKIIADLLRRFRPFVEFNLKQPEKEN